MTVISIAFVLAGLGGCTANQHKAAVAPAGEELTVGVVQKEIHQGMSAADVASVLGSPNIVSSDAQRMQTWIYDRISTDVAYSRSQGAIVGLVFGGSAGGLGSGSVSAGAKSTSQNTLTVVIRFDENDVVRDFSYHASRF